MEEPRVLLWAFGCLPERGSEPGIGWNTAWELSQRFRVWVITDLENAALINEKLALDPNDNLVFEYIKFTYTKNFFKKMSDAFAPFHYLLYLIWQIRAYKASIKLIKTHKIVLIHHVSYSNFWFPVLAAWLPGIFIWNAGGREKYDAAFLNQISLRQRVKEVFRNLLITIADHSFWVKYSSKKASAILSPSPMTGKYFSSKWHFFTAAGLSTNDYLHLQYKRTQNKEDFKLVSVGRLIGTKCYSLAIKAFAKYAQQNDRAEYWIIGDGPEMKSLKKLTIKLELGDRIKFFGWIPRQDLLNTIGKCDVFIHTAFHELSGAALIEAMGSALPVVCLASGGPELIVDDAVGIKVKISTPDQVVNDLAAAIARFGNDPKYRLQVGEAGRNYVHSHLLWPEVIRKVGLLYDDLLMNKQDS